MYYWKSVLGNEENYVGEKIHNIFPLAQRDVNRLVKKMKEDNTKGYIYVFGSAITPLMNPWSDIDIAYDTDKRPRYFSKDYGFDKIDLKDEDFRNAPIYQEIIQGVRIDLDE